MASSIETIAARIHEIADADPRVIEWWKGDGSSEELLHAYAVLARFKGENATLEDVHLAWGIVTAVARPAHQYLVPMNEISTVIQECDRPYLDAIHAVAEELT